MQHSNLRNFDEGCTLSLSYSVSLLQPENIPLFVHFVSLFDLFF